MSGPDSANAAPPTVVYCAHGGKVALDRTLYRLRGLVRERGTDDALSKWCEELEQNPESGRWL